jgi:hypothetical protein
MTTTTASDRWVLARHRLRDDALGVVLLWAGFAVFIFAVVFTVAPFRPIEVSGWETGSQVPRWFAGGVGIYLTAVYLPLYIAHGFTRREIARQLLVATAGTIAIMAGLMTLGYAIERVIYAVAGWPQTLLQSHLFDTASNYPLVYLEFLLLFAVWVAAGAFVGAAIYRNPANGLFAIPIAIVMIGVAESALSPGFFEVITAFAGWLGLAPDGVSVTASLLVTAGCLAVGLPGAWWFVRDMPLRNQRV